MDQWCRLCAHTRGCRACGVDAGTQWLDQQQHAGTATERTIIHAAISAARVIARIPGFQLQQPAFARATDHAHIRALAHEVGKQCNHVEAHGLP